MNNYTPTVGLEIHAELKTRTKMFCNSRNDPDETRPNVNVCPVCMAHPGTLPVINKEAVKHVLKVGVALGGKIADFSEFDRKNYFYPDIPKGYQISQYEYPLVSGGELEGVAITRVHLEEDTARSIHTSDPSSSFVDFNRAGVPLMELVTEPVIKSAEQAAKFGRALRLLLRYLEASEANMEKGEMRVEANISVQRKASSGQGRLGTKVEVKNLNSFRSVERAIDFEIKRQSELLEKGEKVVQETRGWDEDKQITFSQRVKEVAADYRYFPDPDLPKLKISEVEEFSQERLHDELPELPSEKRQRLTGSYGIKEDDAEAYVVDRKLGEFFEAVTSELTHQENANEKIKLASNYITNNLVTLREELNHHVTEKITPQAFAEIINLANDGSVSSNGAVVLLAHVAKEGPQGDTIALAEKLGVLQQSDTGELEKVIQEVIGENQSVVSEYKQGKEQALQFLIGQGMKATKGKANPKVLGELLREKLG